MKIQDIYINGYRSLANVRWQPERLNVLIGPNGSGKSNVLRALQTISTAARGGLPKFIQREGGLAALVWDGQKEEFLFDLTLRLESEAAESVGNPLRYRVELNRLGTTSDFIVGREYLGSVEGFEDDEETSLIDRTNGRARFLSTLGPKTQSVLNSVTSDETVLSNFRGILTLNKNIYDFRREMSEWTVYESIDTGRESGIRQAQVTRRESGVEPDGQNLVSVLHTLYTTDREFKKELNLAMNAAFGDEFEELVFPPAADQRVQMRVRWRSLKREQSAADLSDGTLRFLFLIAVLANPNPPSLIAIDEPESGLHPSMLPIVAEYARDASLRSQVILTTHSPQFLDAFGDDPPSTVVVDWRDGMTSLCPVSGEKLQYWLKQYTLGELFSSRELESME